MLDSLDVGIFITSNAGVRSFGPIVLCTCIYTLNVMYLDVLSCFQGKYYAHLDVLSCFRAKYFLLTLMSSTYTKIGT